MNLQIRKEKITQHLILAGLSSIAFIVFAFFVELVSNDEADISWSGFAWVLNHKPVFWLIIFAAIIFPLIIVWLTNHLTKQIIDKQSVIDHDKLRMQQIDTFAQSLIQGNFDAEFQSLEGNNFLEESLLKLRDTLKSNKELEGKRRQEEEERNWLAEGSAHFGEILRNNINNSDLLSFNVIKDLTKYINAIQGGFYMLNDDDPHNKFFNLCAFFAYDRRKFADQQIKWGDGLIGTCALEQKIIHLRNVPDSYITVTSGLGETKPSNLLVVPLLYDSQVFGVLEFATLHQFDQNHISLVQKIAESIASTLSAVKTNVRTAKLFEESKAQTQALTSHEEEMRQNMEELQATQEEASRQAQQFVLLEETINNNLIRAEFNIDGKLIHGNHLFYKKLEFMADSIIVGKQVDEFISEDSRSAFREVWSMLLKNQQPIHGFIKNITRSGKDLWTLSNYSLVMNENGLPDKVMLFAMDATEERQLNQKYESIIESINYSGIRCEFDINGNVQECNQNFAQIFKLTQKEIKSLTIFDIINPMEIESFNKRWEGIIRGESYTGLLRCKMIGTNEIWLSGTLMPTLNMAHEIETILFIGNDNSLEKRLDSDVRKYSEVIKKQEKQIKDAEKDLAVKIRDTKAGLLNQLKETERLKNINEAILDDSPDVILTIGQDNRIVFFNKSAELLWKLTSKDVLLQDIGILFPEQITDKYEIIGSLVRPGDQKISGKRTSGEIIDSKGKKVKVRISLTKARVDNENFYTAFIQATDQKIIPK
jgi:PAS domain S-box-containing protein